MLGKEKKKKKKHTHKKCSRVSLQTLYNAFVGNCYFQWENKYQIHETPLSEVLRNNKDSQDFEVGDPGKLLYTFATYKQREL